MHDAQTHHLSGVIYDLSGNSLIDTYVSLGASGITEIAVDLDEDGNIDRVLRVDASGTFRDVPVRDGGP